MKTASWKQHVGGVITAMAALASLLVTFEQPIILVVTLTIFFGALILVIVLMDQYLRIMNELFNEQYKVMRKMQARGAGNEKVLLNHLIKHKHPDVKTGMETPMNVILEKAIELQGGLSDGSN